jgi:subtilisin family serine protease
VRPTTRAAAFASRIRATGRIDAQPVVLRRAASEPALQPNPVPGGAYEWQYAAAHEDAVPASVMQAASAVTIAVVDTGADVSAPDIAAKSPTTHSVLNGSSDVSDTNGHGTFVSSLAAGSGTNNEGMAGFGGAAKLLVVQAGTPDGVFTDVDEAAGITYAVDHGAKVVNLSLGGPQTSQTEMDAVSYAASHGVLVVAAAGNSYLQSDPVEYPAALVQPVGSNGQGGTGLAVGASTLSGTRAAFSNTGSYISLAAPGEDVFGDVSSASSTSEYPRVALPGSHAGEYGYGSGTSFATPEVAGVAALVWAANPQLTAGDVAEIVKETASGHGAWNEELGYGTVDAAAAVARALGIDTTPRTATLSGVLSGVNLHLIWSGAAAVSYSLSLSTDGGPEQLVLGTTTATSYDATLARGHTYSFRIAAVDAFGLATMSAPYQVSLAQASGKLRLSASRKRGKHPLRVRFTSVLTTSQADTTVAGRELLFQSYDGAVWRVFGQANTNANGTATVRVKLRRGRFRVRTRFAGAGDLAAANSPAVTVRVR